VRDVFALRICSSALISKKKKKLSRGREGERESKEKVSYWAICCSVAVLPVRLTIIASLFFWGMVII
jgi:hypothetical protein